MTTVSRRRKKSTRLHTRKPASVKTRVYSVNPGSIFQRYCKFVGFLALAEFLLAGLAVAEPVRTVDYNHYSIFPATRSDIAPEMEARTPINIGGNKFMALTNWTVRWRYEKESVPSGCKLSAIDTRLSITFTLPSIPRRHKAPENVYRAFDDYFSKVMAHENNHAENGYQAAKEIDAYLHRVEFSGNCAEMERELIKQTQSIIRFYENRDIEYDRKTGHGKSEGVFLNYYD